MIRLVDHRGREDGPVDRGEVKPLANVTELGTAHPGSRDACFDPFVDHRVAGNDAIRHRVDETSAQTQGDHFVFTLCSLCSTWQISLSMAGSRRKSSWVANSAEQPADGRNEEADAGNQATIHLRSHREAVG
jgi:hypothetical protein